MKTFLFTTLFLLTSPAFAFFFGDSCKTIEDESLQPIGYQADSSVRRSKSIDMSIYREVRGRSLSPDQLVQENAKAISLNEATANATSKAMKCCMDKHTVCARSEIYIISNNASKASSGSKWWNKSERRWFKTYKSTGKSEVRVIVAPTVN